MKRIWKLVCTLALVTFVGNAHAAMPTDMLRIDEVSKVIEENYVHRDSSAGREIEKAFFTLAMKNVTDLAKAEKIYEAGNFASSRFADHVSTTVAAGVSQAMRSPSASERKNALYALLRRSSTLNASHDIITSWLKLPAKTEIKPYINASPPSLDDQIRTAKTVGGDRIFALLSCQQGATRPEEGGIQ